jgi:hypothetical protein
MRLDYFLIWSHGLKFKYEIFSIIREQFPIISINRRNVGDIKGFVRQLYECDTVPFKHLVIKTRYLLKLKPDIAFILVKNEYPDEQIVGSGAFRHKQCMKINRVKAEIRKFNYKEEHVVHASDYESQTKHAMKLLGVRVSPRGHVGVIRTAKLSDLTANIIGVGACPIEQTPHFRYVNGSTVLYRNYYEKHWGTRLTDDHAPEAFDKLIHGFSYDKPIRVSGNRIIDGVHRAAILRYMGVENARVEDISIQQKKKASA